MGQSFPRVTANINSALNPEALGERSILITGCMISGTASSGALVEDLKTEADFNTAFGRASQVAKAGRAMVKALAISRKRPKISAIGLTDNGSGVAATGAIVFANNATAAGTITVYIDSLTNGKYEIPVAVGDTPTVIGAALTAAITANLNSPVSAVNTTGSVALTALNDGTQGNTISLKYDLGTVTATTITITVMSSGATDPVLTTLFDSVANKRFTSIVYPAEWGVSTLTNFTEARFNVDNKILDGLGIVSKTDTYSNINTALDALNQKTLAYIPNKISTAANHKGGGIFESPIVIAAYVAAYRELRLTVGSNTSSIVTNGQSLGGSFFGGIPYHNTPFSLLGVIETNKDFSDIEAQEIEDSGGWLLRNNPANIAVISNEAVTTYKTDSLGNADITFKYVNYLDTLSLCREYIFNSLKRDLSQHILTTGQLIAGRPMVNAVSFIATMMGYYRALSGITGNNDYVLLRAGTAEASAFKKAIEDTIVITLATGTITTDTIANIVTQVRDILINLTPTFE